MADAASFTDPHLPSYRPVPAAGPGVCRVCHAGPGRGQDVCASCLVTMDQVSRPTSAVVPITLYRVPGEMWQVLREYKDGPPRARARSTLQVAALIGRFAARHQRCLARSLGGPPDLVATVPSTRAWPRPAPHPLVTAVTAVTGLARLHTPLLVPGPCAVGHGQADDRAFTVTRRLRGERVLLVDDTFTTGGRAQSAASALAGSGAAAVTVLTAGRVIWPEWNDACRRIWANACARPFSFDTCCLCADM